MARGFHSEVRPPGGAEGTAFQRSATKADHPTCLSPSATRARVANPLAVDVTAGFQPAAVLYAPIALNEVFLAGWLIFRGFDASASARALRSAPQPA